MMNSVILGLFAETFIHPGTGQAAAAIDLPVAREAATDYPFIAGSSLKGALRDKARRLWEHDAKQPDNDTQVVSELFGEVDKAGAILVSDARLLLLPVRSLSHSYRWLTCPHLLERLKRDGRRASHAVDFKVPGDLGDDAILTASSADMVFLEERSFVRRGDVPNDIVGALGPLLTDEHARTRLPRQIALVSDRNFAWFAKYGLAVQARNVLDEQTKESKNLWYEESLPPDTLMYAVLVERFAGTFETHTLQEKLLEKPYIQAGGNETVGQGWFSMSVLGGV